MQGGLKKAFQSPGPLVRISWFQKRHDPALLALRRFKLARISM